MKENGLTIVFSIIVFLSGSIDSVSFSQNAKNTQDSQHWSNCNEAFLYLLNVGWQELLRSLFWCRRCDVRLNESNYKETRKNNLRWLFLKTAHRCFLACVKIHQNWIFTEKPVYDKIQKRSIYNILSLRRTFKGGKKLSCFLLGSRDHQQGKRSIWTIRNFHLPRIKINKNICLVQPHSQRKTLS